MSSSRDIAASSPLITSVILFYAGVRPTGEFPMKALGFYDKELPVVWDAENRMAATGVSSNDQSMWNVTEVLTKTCMESA